LKVVFRFNFNYSNQYCWKTIPVSK